MEGGALDPILQHLGKLAGAATTAADSELLGRFLARRDEDAFAALVRRHGPMVLGVCRRVLHDAHLAEDAFQATFLILARRAAQLQRRESVAAWLHTTAYRLALRSRIAGQRRQHHEQKAQPATVGDPLVEITQREVYDLLDGELIRLPEKLRLPLLLCCIEGKPREEAARELGWTANQVKDRLERGRDALRRRLARRGLALPATFLVAGVTGQATADMAIVCLPLLVARTTALATGRNSSRESAAAALAQAALRGMWMSRVMLVAALVFVAGLAVAGVGMALHAPVPPEQRAALEQVSDAAQSARRDRYGDPLPAGALARLGSVRFRPGLLAEALACSPDGRVLAVAGGGWNGLSLWDAESGRLLHELVAPQELPLGGRILTVAFSPDGRWVAGADASGYLSFWETATGKPVRIFCFPYSNVSTLNILAVAVCPNGTTIATDYEGAVHIWDTTTCRKVSAPVPLKSHAPTALSPDGRFIAQAVTPRFILLSAAPSGAEVRRMGQYDRMDESVIYNINPRDALWGVATGQGPRGAPMQNRRQDKTQLTFSPDGCRLAMYGLNPGVKLWDPQASKEVAILGSSLDRVCAVAFAPDSRTLASGHEDGRVRLWDVASRRPLHQMQAHAFPVDSMAFSGNGTVLFSSSSLENAVRVWDLQTGQERQGFTGPRGVVDWLAFAADGHSLFVSSRDGSLRQWDWKHDREVTLLSWQLPSGPRPKSHGYKACVLTADGPVVAWNDHRGATRVWGPNTHSDPRVVEPGGRSFTLSPDGRWLVLYSGASKTKWEPVYRVWDVRAGRQVQQISTPEKELMALACSPDSRTFVSSGYDPQARQPQFVGLRRWDMALGNPLPGFPCVISPYGADRIAFSADGKLLAATGQRLQPPFAPAVSNAMPVHVWEIDTGKERSLPEVAPSCRALAFSPDSRLLALGDDWLLTDKQKPTSAVVVVEIASGNVVRRLQGHRTGVEAIAFSPDGRLLATGGSDGNVLLWDLDDPMTAAISSNVQNP